MIKTCQKRYGLKNIDHENDILVKYHRERSQKLSTKRKLLEG